MAAGVANLTDEKIPSYCSHPRMASAAAGGSNLTR